MKDAAFTSAFAAIFRETIEPLLEEQRAAYRADLRKALAEFTADASPESEGAFDSKGAAAYLDISTRTLARMKKAGDIPFVRCGRQVRYRKTDLDKYLSENLN